MKNNNLNHPFTGEPLYLSGELLTPEFISGFAQADGSFYCKISINEEKEGTAAIKFRPSFTLTQDTSSCGVLFKILEYFNCGYISHSETRDCSEFHCTSLVDNLNVIIPHFRAFPLFDDKLHAFVLFSEIVSLLDFIKNNNLTPGELTTFYLKILTMALSMNKSSQRKDEKKELLYNILGSMYDSSLINLPQDKSKNLTLTSPLTNDFISGWIDGDSSFSIGFPASGKLTAQFEINFDNNSHGLIAEIRKLIGNFAFKNGITNEDISSKVYPADSNNIGAITSQSSIFRFRVGGSKILNKLIIPWLDSFMVLHTLKAKLYAIWRNAVNLISLDPGFKGEEGEERFFQVVDLAYNMNKGGKNRKLAKSDYIALMLATKFKNK
jgi:LAGLIDADG endonuclease